MVDLDTIFISIGIATNATSLIHTFQEMKRNPEYDIIKNYRNFISWAFEGGRDNPTYEAPIPKHIVAIPLSGPGVVLGTIGRKINNYFNNRSSQYINTTNKK